MVGQYLPALSTAVLILIQGSFCDMAILMELLFWPIPALEDPYDSGYISLATSDNACYHCRVNYSHFFCKVAC